MNPLATIIGAFKNRRGGRDGGHEMTGNFSREYLALQEPGSFAPKLLELWPALDETARHNLRSGAQEYGWEAYFLTDLEADHRAKRRQAAEILGLIGGEQSLWPLLAALADSDEALCFTAVTALKRLATPELMPALLDALATPERWPPARVAEVIMARGGQAVPALLHRLAATPPPSGRGYMIELLGEIGDQGAIAAVAAALTDADPSVRARAVAALVRLGWPPARADALKRALRDGAWQVRVQAVRAAGLLGWPEAVPVLQELRADGDWRVQINVGQALARLGQGG